MQLQSILQAKDLTEKEMADFDKGFAFKCNIAARWYHWSCLWVYKDKNYANPKSQETRSKPYV